MKLTLLPIALFSAGVALAAGNAGAIPRSVQRITIALEEGEVQVAQSRLEKKQHDHAHYNLVFPQSCVDDCRRMVRFATQIESAAYVAQATSMYTAQQELGPDLSSSRINSTVRSNLCSTENVTAVSSCLTCALGGGVPDLSAGDAGETMEWFGAFCNGTNAWQGGSISGSATATGPFTTATNQHLPVGFPTDYPRAVYQASPSGSGSVSGTPTSGQSSSRTSAASASASTPNSAGRVTGGSMSASMFGGVGVFALVAAIL